MIWRRSKSRFLLRNSTLMNVNQIMVELSVFVMLRDDFMLPWAEAAATVSKENNPCNYSATKIIFFLCLRFRIDNLASGNSDLNLAVTLLPETQTITQRIEIEPRGCNMLIIKSKAHLNHGNSDTGHDECATWKPLQKVGLSPDFLPSFPCHGFRGRSLVVTMPTKNRVDNWWKWHQLASHVAVKIRASLCKGHHQRDSLLEGYILISLCRIIHEQDSWWQPWSAAAAADWYPELNHLRIVTLATLFPIDHFRLDSAKEEVWKIAKLNSDSGH